MLNLHSLLGSPVQSLSTDNATAIAFLPGSTGQTRYCTGIRCDYSVAVAAIKTITLKRGGTESTGPLSTVTVAIGSTPTNVSTTAFTYALRGTLTAKGAVAAGTALAAGTIPTNKWGIYRLSITGTTLTMTAGAANFTTGYATEAAAIAALPALPTDHAPVAYITVLTAVGQPFVGGTDALEGGVGGNPSSDTNYYAYAGIGPTTTVAVFKHDFGSKLMFDETFAAAFRGEQGEGLSVELEASGAGNTFGRATLYAQTD